MRIGTTDPRNSEMKLANFLKTCCDESTDQLYEKLVFR